MKIKKIILVFSGVELKKADIPKFRGFLSREYPNYEIIHNHLKDGSLRYSYPLIQFKTIKKNPAIIGINGGIDILKKVFMEIQHIQIRDAYEQINEKSILASSEEKEQGTFTTYYGIPYGLIAFHGVANENAAKTTKLTESDYKKLRVLIILGDFL